MLENILKVWGGSAGKEWKVIHIYRDPNNPVHDVRITCPIEDKIGKCRYYMLVNEQGNLSSEFSLDPESLPQWREMTEKLRAFITPFYAGEKQLPPLDYSALPNPVSIEVVRSKADLKYEKGKDFGSTSHYFNVPLEYYKGRFSDQQAINDFTKQRFPLRKYQLVLKGTYPSLEPWKNKIHDEDSLIQIGVKNQGVPKKRVKTLVDGKPMSHEERLHRTFNYLGIAHGLQHFQYKGGQKNDIFYLDGKGVQNDYVHIECSAYSCDMKLVEVPNLRYEIGFSRKNWGLAGYFHQKQSTNTKIQAVV
ncbi:MAG: hypothetical protein MK052_10370 [Alphaproteobacteria bacterium]|nr:hypothetical protein [Alphaproteobacteria bacterium]